MTYFLASKLFVYFFLFYLVTGIALYFCDFRFVRKIYLTFLFVCLSIPGLTGGWCWPFFNWHLYAYSSSTNFSFNEIRLADVHGNEIKYDARAVPPSLATPVRRLASAYPGLPAQNARELSDFLVSQASVYRGKIESGENRVLSLLKFPRHQMGYKWTKELLSNMSDFSEIRIYRIDINLSRDGREILRQVESLEAKY